MKAFMPKTTIPLLKRVVVFLALFVLASGLIGPRIISGGILYDDGFAIYGGLGKAVLFGLIALVLLIRHKGFTLQLQPWRPRQLVWFAGVLIVYTAAWMSVEALLAGERTVRHLITAHAGLMVSTTFLAVGCFGLRNIGRIYTAYRRQCGQALLIAGLFYIFLTTVYAVWEPLAAMVLHSVQTMLAYSGIAAETVPPNTLLLDKFGVTIAQSCSGIESIALFTGLYGIVGLLDWPHLNKERYFWVFPLALGLLCLLNILRVYALILAGYFINPQIAFSLFHTYAGMVFFILYSVIFWAIAYKYLLHSNETRWYNMTSPKKPKHIIISHVYSRDNKGDAALTSVLIHDLRRKFPQAALTILALQPLSSKAEFEGVPERAGFMSYVLSNSYHPLKKLLRAIYMTTATLSWAVWFRLSGRQLYLPKELRQVAALYAKADLVVPVGGGHIRSQGGLMGLFNVPLLMQPLLFGAILGKPTVLYSQSVGPFRNKFEEWLVGITLKRMALILLREDISMALLARLGVTHNTTRAIDSGFLLESSFTIPMRERYRIPDNALLIGVTVRAWLKGDQQAAYEAAVAKALDTIITATAARVVFIPQVTASKGDDDRVTSRRVYKRMQHPEAATVIEDAIDHYHIKALYDGLDVLLGTRFHSVIFSLTSFVPVLAIEYEHKTSGIMHDLGLDEWVIKIEDVTATKLTKKLLELLAHQVNYKTVLYERVPDYVTKAQQTVDLLEQGYNRFVAARERVNQAKQ